MQIVVHTDTSVLQIKIDTFCSPKKSSCSFVDVRRWLSLSSSEWYANVPCELDSTLSLLVCKVNKFRLLFFSSLDSPANFCPVQKRRSTVSGAPPVGLRTKCALAFHRLSPRTRQTSGPGLSPPVTAAWYFHAAQLITGALSDWAATQYSKILGCYAWD